jgi:hypothetical protein
MGCPAPDPVQLWGDETLAGQASAFEKTPIRVYFGCMRMPPSRRIVSPLIIALP